MQLPHRHVDLSASFSPTDSADARAMPVQQGSDSRPPPASTAGTHARRMRTEAKTEAHLRPSQAAASTERAAEAEADASAAASPCARSRASCSAAAAASAVSLATSAWAASCFPAHRSGRASLPPGAGRALTLGPS